MTNNFGLLNTDIEKIISIINSEKSIEEALIFGSRAKQNFREGSDVDIALKGSKLTHKVVSQISYLLNEETVMPYHFDVVDRNKITNKSLAEHIDRVGVPLLIHRNNH